ncbi:MAG: FecR domain-containing protein [Proteobacteria bacterium]|nr:FecR domain-containing protein [Pseudomonadota bacterium]
MSTEAEIKAAARSWLLRLSLDSPSQQEQADCAAWCAQDPRHAAAYRRIESIWHDAASLKELAPLAWIPPTRDPWWRRLRASLVVHPLRWGATVGLTAALTVLGLWLALAPAQYTTGIAEVRNIRLSDGSDVTMGAHSALAVAFRPHERRVTLSRGVAFFSVAKNPSRPFIVSVGDKEVRVVGTKFEIRRYPESVRVAVVEGTVEVRQVPEHSDGTAGDARAVRPGHHVESTATVTMRDGAAITPTVLTPDDSGSERILTPGQEVITGLTGVIPPPQVMPGGQPAAWRYGRLVYVDTPLKDVIADANRYSREPIRITDPAVANMRVSVTYPSDRIEEMLSALSRTLSLDIERNGTGDINLKARGPGD